MSELVGLHRLSLLVMLAGVIVLYVASVQYAPEAVSVREVSVSQLGEVVHVRGNVSRIAVQDGTTFVTLSEGDVSLPIVWFRPVDGVRRYETVTVEGRVSLYRGALEVVGVRIVG